MEIEIYDFILVIINRLTKMIYNEPVKVTMNVTGFAKVIINISFGPHNFLDSNVYNCGLVLNSKL